ncbi:hypothetical protein PoB_003213500 [Plakobranchus ocellatus]|uniref:Uncharacterized protein n=1 Tax=Plakobranchus ocellatus TaxID=259542 RepID=A0AAV4AE26_9GAST|nr:hypothetical protein PoB_003213500 [Plakobranchus ocellatus]
MINTEVSQLAYLDRMVNTEKSHSKIDFQQYLPLVVSPFSTLSGFSFRQGLDWFLVLVTVLLLQNVIVEPALFLIAAFLSSQIWRTPQIINECVERFKVVLHDVYLQEWLEELAVKSRPLTSFIHKQAAPESASLFHLHDKIHKALKVM